MGVAAAFFVFGALVLICAGFLYAVRKLVVEWVKEDFDERMCVVAVQFGLARLPAAVVTNVRAPLRVVEEKVGRAAEVLLAMCVVALAPVVDRRVTDGAERCFITVEHEFVVAEHALQVFKVRGEALFGHERPHQRTPFGS